MWRDEQSERGWFPSIRKSVSLSKAAGLVFGDQSAVDNSARLQAIIDDADARGKWVELDFADRGPLCLYSGLILLKAAMYGDPAAPRPEFWLAGLQGNINNGLRVSNVASREYKYFKSRRLKGESKRVVSWNRAADGVVTVGFAEPHRWIVGDLVELNYLGSVTQNERTILAVPDAFTITYQSGTSSILSYDPTLSVGVSRVQRKNNKLFITLAAARDFRPGMLVSMSGGAVDTTTVQTYAGVVLNTALVNGGGYFTVPSNPSAFIGYRISAANGAYAENTVVDRVEDLGAGNWRIFASTLTLVSGTTTISIGLKPMTFVGKAIARQWTDTQIVIDDIGPDDVATSIGGGVVVRTVDGTEWAEVRGNRAQYVGYGQFTLGGVYCPGHLFEGIEVRGSGALFDGIGSSEIVGCGAVDTVADGWHLIPFGNGQYSRHVVRDFYGRNTGDDCLAFVGYGKRGHSTGDAVVESARLDRSRARGVLFSGLHNSLMSNVEGWYCQSGVTTVENAGVYNTFDVVNATLRNITARSCGNYGQAGIGGVSNQSGMSLLGGLNVTLDNVTIIDAHYNGIITAGVRGLRGVGHVLVDGTYRFGVSFEPSAIGAGVDIEFDQLTVRNTQLHGVMTGSLARGAVKIRKLVTEDLNSTEIASQFGISTTGALVEYEIGDWTWTKQQHANIVATNTNVQQPNNIERLRRTGRWTLASTVGPVVGVDPFLGGNDLVQLGSGFWNASGNQDYPITLTDEAKRRGFFPLFVELFHNGAITTGSVLNTDLLSIRTLPGTGAGRLLFASGQSLRSQVTNGINLHGRPNIRLGAAVVSGSPILQFSWAQRCDELAVGMLVTGTEIPASTFIAGVDRRNQRVALTAVATGTGLAVTSATLVAGNTSVVVASGTATANGQAVFGDGIPLGTTISSGGGTGTLVLSNAPTITATRIISCFTPSNATGTNAAADLTFAALAPQTLAYVARSATVRVEAPGMSGFNTGDTTHSVRLFGRLGASPSRRARTIAYAASVAVNAFNTDEANIGLLTGNITLANPVRIGTTIDDEVIEGDELVYRFTQDGTGGRTLTWGTDFVAGSFSALPTASGTLNQRQSVTFRWSAAPARWVLVASTGWA